MTELGNENQEENEEGEVSSAEQSSSGAEGKSRSKSAQNNIKNAKDYRKKKKDAVQGKEKGKDTQESSDEDKGHHAAQKAEGDSSGSHSRAGLQSGQTTVQFNSGGGIGGGNAGMTSSLTSLLGLFASSASLVRAEIGAIFNTVSQTANVLLRGAFQTPITQLGNLLGDEGKGGKGSTVTTLDQTSESASNKFILDLSNSSGTHNNNGAQDALTRLLRGISTQSSETNHDEARPPAVPLFTPVTGVPFIATFNSSNFFPGSTIKFAFTNNDTTTPIYRNAISEYIGDAGLPVTDTYSYKVISPVPVYPTDTPGENVIFNTGVTASELVPHTIITNLSDPNISTSLAQADYSEILSNLNVAGITFTPQGDIFVNVSVPTSVLVKIIPAGEPESNGLVVRIDGSPVAPISQNNAPYFAPSINRSGDSAYEPRIPGGIVTGGSSNGDSYYRQYYTQKFIYTENSIVSLADVYPNTMVGLRDGNGQFQQTFFNPSSGDTTIVGNGELLLIGHPQLPGISYSVGTSQTITYLYEKTTYDEIINGQQTATNAFYSQTNPTILTSTPLGNFFNGFNFPDTANNVNTYSLPSSLIFRHSGSSLTTIPTEATYGNFAGFKVPSTSITEYSAIFLPQGSTTDHITFGGNVLDVFGTKYGEGDALIIHMSTNTTASTGSENIITFGGNTLAGFGNAYGDMQTLYMDSVTGANHSSTIATNLIFLGNILDVDKGVDSILFPHLESLILSKDLTDDSNIHLTFKNSIITGNVGSDQFNDNINNLGDLYDTTIYNGFIKGVTVSASSSDQVTIIAGNNSITWGTNIYTGGHTTLNPDGKDSYNFTLIGDMDNNPISEGHAIITDFKMSTDSINFQITPNLFRAFDQLHIKNIDISNLNASATFSSGPISNPNIANYDLGSGTRIQFAGGGSLSLENINISSFSEISNISLSMKLTYRPVESLITAPQQPLVYSGSNFNTPSHFNELDNFFQNSLLATYSTVIPSTAYNPGIISQITPTQDFTFNGTMLQNGTKTVLTFPNFYTNPADTGNVTIDQFGTITVTTSTPILEQLEITATDQAGHSTTSSYLFGFLDAPITTVAAGGVGIGLANPNNIGNILLGEGSTLYGAGFSQDVLSTNNSIYNLGSSALIVDTAGGATAYGDFARLNFTVQGIDDAHLSLSNPNASISTIGNTYNIGANAFNVIGTTFGVAETLTITAEGADNVRVSVSRLNPISLHADASGQFIGNTFNFNQQTIYGAGTLTGYIDTIAINLTGGTTVNGTSPFDIIGRGTLVPSSLDVSADVNNNTFNFAPTTIIVRGDSVGQTTTVVGNVETLNITTKPGNISNTSSNLTVNSSATFSGNMFVFENSYLQGGAGNTIFYGHISNLGDPFGYGNPSNAFGYTGFVSGANVVISHNDENQIVVTDKNNNSITYGNNTYTGGTGHNIYNFTIAQDSFGLPIMQGHDTITNFNPNTDTIVFHIESNLFARLGMTIGTDQITQILNAEKFGSYYTITGSTYQFVGVGGDNGSLTLGGGLFAPSSTFLLLDATYSNVPIQFISTGSTYVPPTINPIPADFDPVKVNVSIPYAFGGFFVGDPSIVQYSVRGGAAGEISLPSTTQLGVTTFVIEGTVDNGITFNSEGTLVVNLEPNKPIDTYLTVGISDGISPSQNLPTVHIFAIASTDGLIHNGPIDPQDPTITATDITYSSYAFETKTPGNTIVASGNDLNFDPTTNPTNAALKINFGSNLIYDVSSSTSGSVTTGHTAVGNINNINFTNIGTTPNSSLNDQIIFFNSNLFNVNAFDTNANTNGAGIYGNNQTLTMKAAGNLVASTTGGPITITPIDNTIKGNSITFSDNKEYGSGNLYGNMRSLSLILVDPTPVMVANPLYGNAFIQGNIFNFGSNTLISQPVNTTFAGSANLYTSVGTLIMANQETSAFPRTGTSLIGGTLSTDGNIFTFKNSTLIAGATPTHFYGDIADLSRTSFVSQIVTIMNPSVGHVSIMDANHNVINWGNNTYITPSTAGNNPNIYTFTIFSLGDVYGAMQGNVTINGFRPTLDTLNFQVAPGLFKSLNTNYDRTLSASELNTPGFTTFSSQSGDSVLSFTPSLNAGSITLADIPNITSYNSLIVTVDVSYPIAPVTVAPFTNANPNPLILSSTGGTIGNGIYYLELDNYFQNVDIANADSTYTVTNYFDNTYTNALASSGITFPQLALNTSAISFSANHFGTITVTDTTTPNTPILSPVIIEANDPHFSTNHPILSPLLVGVFESTGNITSDTNLQPDNLGITRFIGEASRPTYFQGQASNEVIIGNIDPIDGSTNYTFAPSAGAHNFFGGTTYGSQLYSNTAAAFGGNMLINTTPGTTAYGNFENIIINLSNTNTSSFLNVNNYVAQFGQNVFNVTGTVYGVADNFIFNQYQPSTLGFSPFENTFNGTFVFGYTPNPTFSSIGSYGSQTIYGSGTIYGVLNTLEIGSHNSVSDVDFNFANTQVAIMDDQYSTIYSSLDRLIIDTLDDDVTVTFGNTIAIGGSGGANFYPAINDMSSTPFWTDTAINVSRFGTLLQMQDSHNNIINWGQSQIFLKSGSNNIINVTLLDATPDLFSSSTINPVLAGNLNITNFDPNHDVIRFNLSQPLYEYLLSKGPITGASLNEFNSLEPNLINMQNTGGDEQITFTYGSTIKLMGYTTGASLAQFGADAFQLGTTFNGTADTLPGTSNVAPNAQSTFTFTVPSNSASDFSLFQEYDQISNFDTSANTIQITLNQKLYDLLQSSYMFGGTTDFRSIIESSASTSLGGITISKTAAQFDSSNNITFDSSLNFQTNGVTSGTVVLHNVDITNLSDLGSQLSFGQVGVTGQSDTFSFIIPSGITNDLSSFANVTYVTHFDTGTTHDYLQLILPTATYLALSSDGTLNGTVTAAQLQAAGLTVTTGTATTPTIIDFPGINNEIRLEGVTNITSANLDNYLHVGYVEQGTTGQDIFSFTIPSGNSLGAFTQFDHVLNFDSSQDIIQLVVPKDVYYSINENGLLTPTEIINALATNVSTTVGGISVTQHAAQYLDTSLNNIDTVLNFSNSNGVEGAITLHNVNSSLGTNFHFGFTQDIDQLSNNTITFNTIDRGNGFGSFTQYDHLTNFDLGGSDKLQFALSENLYNQISQSGTLDSFGIANYLDTQSINGSVGSIVAQTSGGSTVLTFGSNSQQSGSITLDNFILSQGKLAELGTHIEFGKLLQGTSGTDLFSASASAGNPSDLSSFKEFDHIIDFDNSADNLHINISTSLYDTIDHFLNPSPLNVGTTTNAQLIDALATGSANGHALNTQINIVEVNAQFPVTNAPIDTILQFVNQGNISGSITLHNVNLNGSLTNLNNLLITHS